MKWGQRRADGSYKNLGRAQNKYDRTVSRNFIKIHNAVADDVNSGRSDLIPRTNKKIAAVLKKSGHTTIDSLLDSGNEKHIRAYDDVMNTYFVDSAALMKTKVKDLYGERPS